MQHVVVATIRIDLESKDSRSPEDLQTFLNEMDYGFTPTLFDDSFKVKDIEWVECKIHHMNHESHPRTYGNIQCTEECSS